MSIKFNTIKEFLSFKSECPFCKNKLRPLLSNFVLKDSVLASLNSGLDCDTFKFKINHHSPSWNVETDAKLCITNNALSFSISDPQSQYLAAQAFELLSPHVELYCSKKTCKYKYFMNSTLLHLNFTNQNWYPIKAFNLDTEIFVLKNLWIQNNYHTDKTQICSINNMNSDPISAPMISFSEIPPEQLFNKIKTIINFG